MGTQDINTHKYALPFTSCHIFALCRTAATSAVPLAAWLQPCKAQSISKSQRLLRLPCPPCFTGYSRLLKTQRYFNPLQHMHLAVTVLSRRNVICPLLLIPRSVILARTWRLCAAAIQRVVLVIRRRRKYASPRRDVALRWWHSFRFRRPTCLHVTAFTLKTHTQ